MKVQEKNCSLDLNQKMIREMFSRYEEIIHEYENHTKQLKLYLFQAVETLKKFINLESTSTLSTFVPKELFSIVAKEIKKVYDN